MSTSFLLAAAAAAWKCSGTADDLPWLALFGVLLAKAGVEERALLQRFPDYLGFRRRTTRFVPWLA